MIKLTLCRNIDDLILKKIFVRYHTMNISAVIRKFSRILIHKRTHSYAKAQRKFFYQKPPRVTDHESRSDFVIILSKYVAIPR